MKRYLVPAVLFALSIAACTSKDELPSRVSANPPSVVQSSAGEVIGHLETRTAKITIYSGEPDPIYTVQDLDGRVLAERLTLEELRVSHPELHRAVGSVGNDASYYRDTWKREETRQRLNERPLK